MLYHVKYCFICAIIQRYYNGGIVLSLEEEYLKIKREFLKQEFSRMNEMQQRAVFTVNGPLLILAGAGSGKTTVIVQRIAYMLRYGNAYWDTRVPEGLTEETLNFLRQQIKAPSDLERVRQILAVSPPKPWQILAITFTNKAAGELRERLTAMLGESANEIYAGTFHSQCVRILRANIESIGYRSNFTIYDTDDSKRVLKEALTHLRLNPNIYPIKTVLNEISRAKDQMIYPDQYATENDADFRKKEIAKIYAYYQNHLKLANAVDFDDIICLTVQLFEQCPDILEKYRNRFRYILVDEYQDTNHAQYRLVSLLSGGHHNLCVVGDDDQSIYRFRGATIENILSFEKQFQNATVVRLEQNYRSTQNILSAANFVIQNNRGRKGKNLWTDRGDGDKLSIVRVATENAEAEFVADTLEKNVADGKRYGDHAILYRMNAQSATLERFFVRRGIPYKIVGGTKFYDRKEIKDILAYLCVINNTSDNLRLTRIINEPKRGIGPGTLAKMQEIADGMGTSLYQVMREADTYSALSSKAQQLLNFSDTLSTFIDLVDTVPLEELLDQILENTGYGDMLEHQGAEGANRLENIQELKTNMIEYQEQNDDPSLSGFLEEIALYTDLDDYNGGDDRVTLMTLHAAKGLEFPVVFLVGMEEEIFPGRNANTIPEEMEEERRLAYVGITRAKNQLYLTNAAQRTIFGSSHQSPPSRFLAEIPEEYCVTVDKTPLLSQRLMEGKRLQKTGMTVEGVGRTAKTAPVNIDYQVGDVVSHAIFGKGTILSMDPMGNDVLVEVDFDKKGRKKVMANYAKLKKM